MTGLVKIKTALISVSDKSNIVELATALKKLNVKILSTGGTAKLLSEQGCNVIEVSQHTGSPEILDGRVKTLHPKIHGGILGRRGLESHSQQMEAQNIETIDLVVVNLYPFQATIANPNCSLEDAIENIDIGGPAMIRSSAKNYNDVAVITDPSDYAELIQQLEANNGETTLDFRFKLMKKAFTHTSQYDGAISNYFTGLNQTYPDVLNVQFHKAQELRYGENPHQTAGFYVEQNAPAGSLATFTQLQGKELSYNNIADSDAAWSCVKAFEAPACVIIKHANPCGVAIAENCHQAYLKAFATDPVSAFGGIIAFNRRIDLATAEAVCKQFMEVLIAPSISDDAKALLATKQNVRVLIIPNTQENSYTDYKRVSGGLLVQNSDDHILKASDLKVVTQKAPTDQQLEDLMFAWNVAKFVKSNAIIFVGNGQTLGVGAGQMSRVDSTKIAQIKAQNAGLNLVGSCVASDAFFPFRDGIDVIAQAGATAIIQPGGSIRDQEVIDAANEHGIAMVYTGVRHFRH